MGLMATVLLLPLYLVLHSVVTPATSGGPSSYSTHSRTYAFEVSAVFLSGIPPGVLLAVVWLVSVVSFVHGVTCICRTGIGLCHVVDDRRDGGGHRRRTRHRERRRPLLLLDISWKTLRKTVFPRHLAAFVVYVTGQALIFLILAAVFVAMNVGFVYAQVTYGPNVTVLCQIGLALLDMLINHLFFPWSIRWLRVVAVPRSDATPTTTIPSLRQQPTPSATTTTATTTTTAVMQRLLLPLHEQRLHLLLTLWATLVAPCLAAALYSSNCLYHAIFATPSVTTVYGLIYCEQFLIYILVDRFQCTVERTTWIHISFRPSFVYSYGCSAYLVASYTSVFVYSYLLDCFLRPVSLYAVKACWQYGQRVLCRWPWSWSNKRHAVVPVSSAGTSTTEGPVSGGSMQQEQVSRPKRVTVQPKVIMVQRLSTTTDPGLELHDEGVGYDKEAAIQAPTPSSSTADRSSGAAISHSQRPSSSSSIFARAPILRLLSQTSSQWSKASTRPRRLKDSHVVYRSWQGESLVRTMVQASAVILSFGLVYPPLLVIVVVALSLSGVFSTNETFLEENDNTTAKMTTTASTRATAEVRVEAHELMQTLHTLESQVVWLVLPLSALFLSLAMFDALGDVVGWIMALPLPVGFLCGLWMVLYGLRGWMWSTADTKTVTSGVGGGDGDGPGNQSLNQEEAGLRDKEHTEDVEEDDANGDDNDDDDDDDEEEEEEEEEEEIDEEDETVLDVIASLLAALFAV